MPTHILCRRTRVHVNRRKRRTWKLRALTYHGRVMEVQRVEESEINKAEESRVELQECQHNSKVNVWRCLEREYRNGDSWANDDEYQQRLCVPQCHAYNDTTKYHFYLQAPWATEKRRKYGRKKNRHCPSRITAPSPTTSFSYFHYLGMHKNQYSWRCGDFDECIAQLSM